MQPPTPPESASAAVSTVDLTAPPVRIGAAGRSGAPADLLGLPVPALAELLDRLGVGGHLAGRVFGAVHRRGLDLAGLDAVIGTPKADRLRVGACLSAVSIEAVEASPDGVEKLVFRLADGARVEGVLIPMKAGRVTLCLSSQVGCAMACAFCATGTLGLARSLSPGEMVAQVRAARARVTERGATLSHLVFMGMGEPLHHYPATRDALRVLLDVHGQPFKARNITVSTVGVVPKMLNLSEDFGGRVQLALSLHAGTDATRKRIIPLAARYDLAALKAALVAHPLPGSMALMLEYVVLPGVNDGAEELAGLVQFAQGLRAIVNLIPFNPFPGAGFRAPTASEVERVEATLRRAGLLATIRWPRGRGANGACGQLALNSAAAT